MFAPPLLDELVGLLHGLSDGLVAAVSLPQHAPDVENADHGTAELVAADLNPSTVGLDPPGNVRIAVVEYFLHGSDPLYRGVDLS